MTTTDIEWRTISVSPVSQDRFGADHWSMLAYLETRTVDHRGTIAHDHMRTHARRHPIMMSAKKTVSGAAGDGSRYPTLLAGGEQLTDHDDYDCIDDLIAAGLPEVHMPELVGEDRHIFVDAYGRPIVDPDGDIIVADEVTGWVELWLCAFATFSLTARGAEIAAKLRQHRAACGNFGSFRLE